MQDNLKCVLNAMLLGAAVAGAAEVADELASTKNMGKKMMANRVAKMNAFLEMMAESLEGTAKTCDIDISSDKLQRLISETKGVVDALIEKDELPVPDEAKTLHEGFVAIRETLFDGVASQIKPAQEAVQ